MIRVTVEVVPRGDERRKRTVAQVEIQNDCSGSELIGYYNADYRLPAAAREGTLRVSNWPRAHLLGLCARVLQSIENTYE